MNILGALLPSGADVAINIGRDGAESVYETASGSRMITVPTAVIVNSRTKGPAELFAAVLKDGIGASIVGTQTAGEGDFFETYPLYDGSAIVLPISTLRSTNIEIEGVGVKPDYEAPVAFDDTDEELALLDETTDPALKRAIEVLTNLLPPE